MVNPLINSKTPPEAAARPGEGVRLQVHRKDVPLAAERGGQLWCVFGCGGNRDAAKRPLMGAVAQQHADQVVVTSDNPRSEDPAAIRLAQQEAAPADVVLIAGKGHEDTQETAGVRVPFSDMAHAQRALDDRGTRP